MSELIDEYRDVARQYRGTHACAAILGLITKLDRAEARAAEAERLLKRAHVHLTTTYRDAGKSHDKTVKAIRAFLDSKP